MSYYYEYELGKAAKILCEDLCKLKRGETFVITADTECDKRVIDATATAAFACDAKPMVIYTASPLVKGKAGDSMLPFESLTAALLKADAWVEFNNKGLINTTIYDIAMKENKKLRHMCLMGGANVGLMVRNIGRVDYPNLEKFMKPITKKTLSAKHMRITTPAGTDVEFNNEPGRNVDMDLGYADTPGSHMMAGQIGWSPNFESINGTIVFDGSISPLGLLKEPVRLKIKKGEIVKIEGGKEATEYEKWLKSFNHPQMLKLAHVCYGFNPGARLTGVALEDERIWGGTEWGIGNVVGKLIPGGIYGPSHSDGICLNSSVWLDGVQIMDKGQLLDPELKKLAEKLEKVYY
jgi:leucyl aminopeptidase (aminopeptidase T)